MGSLFDPVEGDWWGAEGLQMGRMSADDRKVPQHVQDRLQRFDSDLFCEWNEDWQQFVVYQAVRTAFSNVRAMHPVLECGTSIERLADEKLMWQLYEQRLGVHKMMREWEMRQIDRLKGEKKARADAAGERYDSQHEGFLAATRTPEFRNRYGGPPRVPVSRTKMPWLGNGGENWTADPRW